MHKYVYLCAHTLGLVRLHNLYMATFQNYHH